MVEEEASNKNITSFQTECHSQLHLGVREFQGVGVEAEVEVEVEVVIFTLGVVVVSLELDDLVE